MRRRSLYTNNGPDAAVFRKKTVVHHACSGVIDRKATILTLRRVRFRTETAMTIPPLSIAAAGMQNAANRFEASARRTASGSPDDLAVEAVEQIRAKQDFSANAAVIRTADEMTGTLLDVLV
jgi:hypothetical protein